MTCKDCKKEGRRVTLCPPLRYGIKRLLHFLRSRKNTTGAYKKLQETRAK
jgi:hypothetical protein